MRFLSLCSGIEAASVAWNPLGMTAVGFSEIEKFPCSLLAHHYPEVPNLGNMLEITDEQIAGLGPVDIVVGGTPCQSFSIAGLRGGLADARGNLALRYCQLLAQVRPRWFVWENVPGVLSSNGGRDFGAILGAMAELGYGWAYRVMDAQFYGVPQRRRRVFIVGCLGDWRRSGAVLSEPEGLRGDSPPGRKAGKDVAGTLSSRTSAGGGLGTDFDLAGGVVASTGEIAHCLNAGAMGRIDYETETMVTSTSLVRRLTVTECERLQGFPDSYTLIPHRGRTAADGPRYKALGNSMAIPVVRWIGERILKVEKLCAKEAE